MQRFFKAALTASVLALTAGAQSARAGQSDLAIGGFITAGNPYGQVSKTLSAPGTVSYSKASLTMTADVGGASITAKTSTSNLYFFVAGGGITYYGDVVGADALVPLRLYYTLQVQSDPGGAAFGSLTFDNALANSSSHNGSFGYGSGSGYLLATEHTNAPIKITLSAETLYGGYAYVDPLLEIDPDWAASHQSLASQLSIQLSNGVVNGFGAPGGVPEPASWAMMVAGVALSGAALRRRGRRLAV